MPDPARREIVVVGGGIIGVCIAYYIVSALESEDAPSAGVTLVEEEGIASAASGKAGGFLALDWHGPATTSLAKLSYRLYQELAEEHDGAERWGYRAMDSLSFTISANIDGENSVPESNYALEETHVHFKEPNGNDPEEAGAHWLNPNGDKNVLGTRDTTGQVHPRLFTEGIFSIAVKKGLKYIRARAAKLNCSSSTSLPESLEILRRDDQNSSEVMEALPCTDLVLAAGPWTTQVATALGISPAPPISNMPGHSVLISPVHGAAMTATAVFASIYGANPRRAHGGSRMTESPELFPRPDGVVYVAGENEARDIPERPGEVNNLIDNNITERLVRAAGVVAHELGEGTVEARQLCYRPITPDRRPIVGKLKEHIWVASGHGPWGIALAPGTGKVMAELMMDGKAASAEIDALDPGRFST